MRIEEDLLGKKTISDDCFYGIHTLRAIENFRISGEKCFNNPTMINSLVQVKKAVALAHLSLELLPSDICTKIIDACDHFLDQGQYINQFPIDAYQGGAGTSLNMNVNEVIANIALVRSGYPKGRYDVINPNDHVNKSQSTNDAYPTAFRIALYHKSQCLMMAIEHLEMAFSSKAEEFKNVLKMGRTQLQDAVPMTLGQEFAAFSTSMREERKLIKYSIQLLLEINLGGTAIGTGINTSAGFQKAAVDALSSVTELPLIASEDLIEATSDCGAYVMLHSSLKRLALKLSKICNDLRLLSSGPRGGLNEINLPQKQAGSSIMPGKVNPVIPEVVNQVCFRVMGNDLCVSMAAEAGQLQLNVMEPVIALSMFESLSLLTKAMDNLNSDCISGITANKTICENYVLNSVSIVTLLNPWIGHHNGDRIAQLCMKTGRNVREVILEEQLMDAEFLDGILSPSNLLTSPE